MNSQSTPSSTSLRALYLIVAASVSMVIALVAGILVCVTGKSIVDAILYGGGVFVAFMTLSIAMITVLSMP
ncbi:hypothetical protein ACIQU3_09895 [Streptomyces sp. NPDC101110]|uniref:hypothetical protein n=1 Tax=Streptomyces sp. NPDC101110 TaxID=3366104 RepID=UPI0038164CE7